jgi:L-amino acid N-acyltransferase YncA
MTQNKRLFMEIDLSIIENFNDSKIRKINQMDQQALSELMLDSYRGTIDYGGETLEEASLEIAGTLQGKYGKIIEDACLVIEENKALVSAIIINYFEKEKMPLVTFTMTRALNKGKGFAKKLLKAGLTNLKTAGHKTCCLYVTEGNEPAIAIYKSLGFKIQNS